MRIEWKNLMREIEEMNALIPWTLQFENSALAAGGGR